MKLRRGRGRGEGGVEQKKKNPPIIPQRARPRRPIEAHLDIDAALKHIIQIIQHHVALRLVQPDNPHRHLPVHKQRLPPRARMHPHQWVLALDVLRARRRVLAVQVGVCRAVDGRLAVDELAEGRGELLVRAVAGRPEGVAADGGDRVIVQVRVARRLALVDEVGVPDAGGEDGAEVGPLRDGVEGGPDHGDAGNTGDLGCLGLMVGRWR